MPIPFVKLHGLGNDFVVVRESDLPDLDSGRVRDLCDRHTGIGADGILVASCDPDGLPRMTVHNADGSVPEMCGNGLRCFAKWLGDTDPARSDRVRVWTGAGLLDCQLHRGADGRVAEVTVAMGRASWAPAQVPVLADAPMVAAPFEVGGVVLRLTALAIGNPHAVTFDALPYAVQQSLGPLLSRDPRFPAGVNAEFAQVVDTDEGPTVHVAVFERGCGWTQACGTGATATVLAGVRLGLLPPGRSIPTRLPGGWLHIAVDADGSATMRGPAVRVFDGAL
ncbi:MAG: diaminopimelate epimerase [Deltaproteobacteria bacterium]|nr:diaminopimelate epimerase [Deltaproteobacteria bacterium]